MKKYSSEQSGRSMIEMLGVLAIVGVLSVAGIAGYSKAMSKYKNNKALDQISTIAANIKTIFASTGTYGGLTADAPNATAYKLGIFPDEMTKTCTSASDVKEAANMSTSCIKNGLNGGVSVAHADSKLAFTIQFAGLTKDACVAIVTSDWGGSAGFKGVNVSGTYKLSPSLGDATTVCNAEGAGNSVTLKFY